MEKFNVFVFAIPTFDSLVTKLKNAIENSFDEEKDFTPNEVEPSWGVGGKKADENLRFGYGLEVDEPRWQDYDDEDEYLDAREAFDDFVTSGERCVELGLDKKNDAPITKCNAVRKPIGCPPPMNKELIGESQFPWWEMDIDWDF